MPIPDTTTEDYDKIVVDKPIDPKTFNTDLPPGITAQQMPNQSMESKPPVALGSLAPDFEATALASGIKTKVSSFRGQVVMLDFWATWCPPCRASLPETEALSTKYSGKGLVVMAISDETAETVKPFLSTNHYDFPTYLDSDSSANSAYKITGIPAVAIIDKQGRLSAFFVGLQQPDTVKAALAKAGLAE
jgi:thiol-disulfide isomerase/thioredoxin